GPQRLTAHGRAVEGLDLGTQRHPDEPGMTEGRALEGDAHETREPAAEAVRHARACVRLVQRERHPCSPSGKVGGGGDVAADAHDDVDAAVADQGFDGTDDAREPRRERKGSPARPAREGQLRDRDELVAALRHQASLEALSGAQHDDARIRFVAADAVGDGKERVDVPGRAPAAEEVHGHLATLCRSSAGLRANERAMPIAAMPEMSAVPPAEISGSGTPSTGSTPSTTAMLTKA